MKLTWLFCWSNRKLLIFQTLLNAWELKIVKIGMLNAYSQEIQYAVVKPVVYLNFLLRLGSSVIVKSLSLVIHLPTASFQIINSQRSTGLF